MTSLALVPHPAYAQDDDGGDNQGPPDHWEFWLKSDGVSKRRTLDYDTNTLKDINRSVSSPNKKFGPPNEESDDWLFEYAEAGYRGGADTATVDLMHNFVVTARWVNGNGGPATTQAPDKVTAKILSKARSSWLLEEGSGTASNGLGTKPVLFNRGNIMSIGYGLRSVDNSAHANEVEVAKFSAHATGNAPQSTSNNYTYAEANVTDIQEDNRSVKLTRNAKDIFKNVGGNWVTYGDTRWSYLNRIFHVKDSLLGGDYWEDKPQIVKQPVFVNPIGDWQSAYPDYKWNPSALGDTTYKHTQEMTQGNSVWNPEGIEQEFVTGAVEGIPFGGYETKKGLVPGGWYDAKHGDGDSTLKVFYRVTDADGATAEATYVFTMHDAWENPTPDDSMSWIEAPNQIVHKGESLSAWQFRKVGFTSPSKDSDWGFDAKADLEVKLTSELKGDFGVADWLKISGSATTTATLDASTLAKIHIKPSEIFGNGPSDSSYAAVIRFKVKNKQFLLDHYLEDGRDINPARNALPTVGPLHPPSDGKWPQTGKSEVVQPEPYWVEVKKGEGQPTDGDHPLPTSTPQPPSATVTPDGTFHPITSPPVEDHPADEDQLLSSPPSAKSTFGTNSGSAPIKPVAPTPKTTPRPSGNSS